MENIVSGQYSMVFGHKGFTDKSETCVFSDGFNQIEINKFGEITSNDKEVTNDEIANILSGAVLFMMGYSKDDYTTYNKFIRVKKLKRILGNENL